MPLIATLKTEIINGIEYAIIPLTKGYYTLIDIEDFSRISKRKWFACVGHKIRAARMEQRRMIYIQHEILRIMPWELRTQGLELDHIDGNTLHNWKANLHKVTHTENMRNTSRHKNRIGVSYSIRAKLWLAYLDYPDKPRKYLGYRKTREEAELLVYEARNANN